MIFFFLAYELNFLKSSIFKENLPYFMQVGPSYCTSIKELVSMLIRISEKKLRVKYDMTKPEGDTGRYANCEKALKYLDWKPEVDLYEGLKKTYDWIMNNLKSR